MKAWALAGVIMFAAANGVSAQDLAAGETSFKKCLPCHRVGPDAKNLVGPLLNGLEGRKSGTILVPGILARGSVMYSANVFSSQTMPEFLFASV